MIKHENHAINTISKTSENSNDFLRSLAKSLKIKFLHPMSRSMIMLSFKMRNLISSTSNRPEVFYKKVVLNNFGKLTGKHVCQSLILIELQV